MRLVERAHHANQLLSGSAGTSLRACVCDSFISHYFRAFSQCLSLDKMSTASAETINFVTFGSVKWRACGSRRPGHWPGHPTGWAI